MQVKDQEANSPEDDATKLRAEVADLRAQLGYLESLFSAFQSRTGVYVGPLARQQRKTR